MRRNASADHAFVGPSAPVRVSSATDSRVAPGGCLETSGVSPWPRLGGIASAWAMDDLFPAGATSARVGLAIAVPAGLFADASGVSGGSQEAEGLCIGSVLDFQGYGRAPDSTKHSLENSTYPKMTKPIVLILCTGNSCRSHLAEGLLRAVAGDILEVQSAGSKPAGYVHQLGIRVMQEIGIDISGHHSKHMNEFLNRNVETVITVCGNADQACPIYPGQLNRHHWGFDDPANATGTEDEILAVFRRVRDEIRRVLTAYAEGRRDQLKWMRQSGVPSV